MNSSFSKYQIATSLAILFHVIGITGILFFDKDLFIRSTPFNLLLMFALLLWTQKRPNKFFLLFVAACFLAGVGAEVIGVNTSALFGNYQYGNVLGPKLLNVPLIIGINWFIIIYCCGISIHTLLMKIINRVPAAEATTPQTLKALSIIIDSAMLAVFFDWLMEPVAVKLNYWHWNGDGSVPFYNYICWFMVSVLLLSVFHFCNFDKQNKFAVNLLLVQFMFFLVLKTFMN
ncbi:MAG: carotenoid biosynthesis protein [Ferruginibacter sp.]